jgi:hypothetical protein
MSADTNEDADRETTVPIDEVKVVASMARRFARRDERDPLGNVLLVSDDGHRRWVVGNGSTFAIVRGGAERSDFDLMISARLPRFAATTSDDDAVLSVHSDDHGTAVRIAGSGGSLDTRAPHRPDQRLRHALDDPADSAASMRVDAPTLGRLIAAAAVTPIQLDDREPPLFWLWLDGGALDIRIDWEELGTAHYRLVGRGTGRAHAAARPGAFAEALRAFDEEVTITLTSDPDGPITIESGDVTVRSWPVATTFERLRGSVEEKLADAFGPLVLHRDRDGDYPIRRRGIPIFARLVDGDPVTVQIFAVLLRDVEPTTELLSELNDLNAGLTFVRTVCVAGQVLAEADLIAHTLDLDELRTAASRIGHLAEDLVPLVAAVHGGSLPDPQAARFEEYRNTWIDAELSPGREVQLSGPDAMEEWGLPAEVYVVTAWNADGLPLPRSVNDDANDALAAQIQSSGGAYLRALGYSPDDVHREPSFLVWDIDRDGAIALGRMFRQDAIFALTSDDVILLSCLDDTVDSWPRRWADDGSAR